MNVSPRSLVLSLCLLSVPACLSPQETEPPQAEIGKEGNGGASMAETTSPESDKIESDELEDYGCEQCQGNTTVSVTEGNLKETVVFTMAPENLESTEQGLSRCGGRIHLTRSVCHSPFGELWASHPGGVLGQDVQRGLVTGEGAWLRLDIRTQPEGLRVSGTYADNHDTIWILDGDDERPLDSSIILLDGPPRIKELFLVTGTNSAGQVGGFEIEVNACAELGTICAL